MHCTVVPMFPCWIRRQTTESEQQGQMRLYQKLFPALSIMYTPEYYMIAGLVGSRDFWCIWHIRTSQQQKGLVVHLKRCWTRFLFCAIFMDCFPGNMYNAEVFIITMFLTCNCQQNISLKCFISMPHCIIWHAERFWGH